MAIDLYRVRAWLIYLGGLIAAAGALIMLSGCSFLAGGVDSIPVYLELAKPIIQAELAADLPESDEDLLERKRQMELTDRILGELLAMSAVYNSDLDDEIERRGLSP
jgi:hypothetical protein